MEFEDGSPNQVALAPVYVILHRLEQTIAPWLTTQKTDWPIQVRGKRQYLKPLPVDAKRRDTIMYAYLAHEALYEFEDAVKNGKIDRAMRTAVAFAQSYYNFGALKAGGLDDFRLRISAIQERARRRKAAKTVNADHVKLHTQYQPEVDRLIAGGLKYTPACVKVAASLGVTDRTVRNHTKNPTPRNCTKRKKGTR